MASITLQYSHFIYTETSNYYFDAVQTQFPLGNANLLLDKYVKSAGESVRDKQLSEASHSICLALGWCLLVGLRRVTYYVQL